MPLVMPPTCRPLAAFTSPPHLLPSQHRNPNLHPPPPRFRRLYRPALRQCRCESSPEPAIEPPATSANPDSPPQQKQPPYQINILSSVTELSQPIWDRFATAGCACPFLRHDWLRCLEQSGCVSASTGWIPQHIVLRDASGEVVVIAPAYVKQHSLGEFVFDQDWAEAAYGAGIAYYPKLLLAVPFTPATGRRVLTVGKDRGRLLKLFASLLMKVCKAMDVSSVHVNFCVEDEVRALSDVGFLERKGVQYHFGNYRKGGKDGEEGSVGAKVPYRDFEDYLGEFKSKRRIKMRRERKVVREESGLRIEVVRGEQIDDELMVDMFYVYKSTIDKLFYGRQYLTLEFFKLLAACDQFKDRICLVLARSNEDDKLVGGTFNIVGEKDGGAFYGRYWGCLEEHRYLHFETCYYAAIEYCIDQGLSRMEPGAGGGDFKFLRGFEPCVTYSMHYVRDARLSAAVERFLRLESLHVDGAVIEMTQRSAIRSKENRNGASAR